MGIKGLWKEVQPVCRAGHVSQFAGQRVGVDTYCWLHRAVISCALDLATGKPCDRYLTFLMSRVDLLLRYGVTPVLVFDGDAMPMKKSTDTERKARREIALRDGQQLLQQGAVDEAARCFEKSIDVTTEIAKSVIDVMRDRGIECIVAPYEADAQLGYLVKEGYVTAVISEDSDLIVYHCTTVLAKMDPNGNCDCLHAADLPNLPLLSHLSYESFVLACIMSGCDYVSSLPNIGMKTALRLVGGAKSVPLLMQALITQHGFSLRDVQQYEEMVHKAYYCFAHHLVYNPLTKSIEPFRPFPEGVVLREELLGARWPADEAVRVCALFELDPISKLPYQQVHAANVDMYLRKTHNGQRRLTSFNAFEKLTSAKIVMPQETSNRPAAASHRLADSPGMRQASAAHGFLGGEGHRNAGRLVVRSKYFSKAHALVDTSSSSDNDNEVSSRGGVETLNPRRLDVDSDVETCCTSAPLSVPPLYPPAAAAPSPSCSTTEPYGPSAASNSPLTSDAVVALCPYGYHQCGRKHSVFLKCFAGKDWVRDDATPSNLSPVSNLSQPLGCTSSSSLTQRKRQRENIVSSPPDVATSPLLTPPEGLTNSVTSSTLSVVDTNVVAPLHALGGKGNQKVVGESRRLGLAVPSVVALRQVFEPSEENTKREPAKGPTAAKLFEQLSFSRK